MKTDLEKAIQAGKVKKKKTTKKKKSQVGVRPWVNKDQAN